MRSPFDAVISNPPWVQCALILAAILLPWGMAEVSSVIWRGKV